MLNVGMAQAATVSTAAVAAGAVSLAEDPSVWSQVFDEHMAVVAIFGGLGSICRWLFLKEPLGEALRLIPLGILMAVGLGNLARLIVLQYFPDAPESIWTQPLTAYNIAFFVGLGSVTILGWMFDRGERLRRVEQDANGNTS